ncbi:MAG: LLM class flavin-dependent oxidoreductase [Ktedonobacteraceae bacterium]|nr:LLM class flavin-dependent oxidoreductase [Ktedonobacteraceae bacterium]
MAIPLSVLDLSPVDSGSTGAQALRNTIELARQADKLGYTRYWLAEHHNTVSLVSSAPEIMIGHVAEATTHIRVGSGGIMLPNHAPLKVAETFRVLEALHPGRIDLGIGRAPGTDRITALALRGTNGTPGADEFPELLAELLAFTGGQFPERHPFRTVKATPNDVDLPPIWLLGSSDYSAQAAAQLGLGFAFAHHINPVAAVPAIKLYRDTFTPSVYLKEPHIILATSAICAETDERAEYLASSMRLTWARMQSGKSAPIPSPEEASAYHYNPLELVHMQSYRARQMLGSAATVKARLLELIEQTGANELMITTLIYGHENRVRSYELLAEAFELQQPPVAR